MRGSSWVRASRGASVLVAVLVLILVFSFSRVRGDFLARHRGRAPTARLPCKGCNPPVSRVLGESCYAATRISLSSAPPLRLDDLLQQGQGLVRIAARHGLDRLPADVP